MNDTPRPAQTRPGTGPTFETLREDAAKLLADIGTVLSSASDDAKVKLEASRSDLEARLDEAKEKSDRLRASGGAAGEELKSGLAEAIEALRTSIAAARDQFSKE